jgi:hypothetical protein
MIVDRYLRNNKLSIHDPVEEGIGPESSSTFAGD